jgi:hypothetical protein
MTNKEVRLLKINVHWRPLFLTALLAAILLTGLTACTPGDVTEIELGLEYSKTITVDDRIDPEDRTLRGHVYTLNVASGDTYSIEVSSTSDDTIMVNEYRDKKHLIINIKSKGNWTTKWTFYSDGEKEIWVQASKFEVPSEYTFRVTRVEDGE